MARARVSSPPASEHHEVTTNRPAKARPRRRSVKASEISQFDLNDRGSLQHWLALFIDPYRVARESHCISAALLHRSGAAGHGMDHGRRGGSEACLACNEVDACVYDGTAADRKEDLGRPRIACMVLDFWFSKEEDGWHC